MPNIKSAKKRVVRNNKKKIENNTYEASMKNAIKKVEKISASDSKEGLNEAVSFAMVRIDKACSKGLVHKNTAARYKSRVSKMAN